MIWQKEELYSDTNKQKNDYEDKSIIEEAHPRLQNRTSQGSPVRYQQEEP